MNTWTVEDLEKKVKAGTLKGFVMEKKEPQKKKSKYGNMKVDLEGKPFDSKKEAKRYKELNLLLKAGKIGMLSRQSEFELNAGGTHSVKYVADFCYVDRETGLTVIEDVKGFITPGFRKKAKLMKKVHGIEITVIK